MSIGHNNPPAVIQHSLKADEMLSLVSDTTAGVAVTTDEQEAALDDILKEARAARKAADNDRAAEKKPHDDAGRAVQEAYRPILGKFDAVMDEIRAKLTPYREAKQRAKDEAARKAREEAEAKQMAAQEALRSSDDLEGRVNAEAELAKAKKLAAVANKIDRSATGLRSRQVAVVTDHRKLLLHIAHTDKPALDAFLDEYARKALPSKLPGVEIHTERRAA